MPIYEFHCNSCNRNFDKLCSIKDNLAEVTCKYCSEKNAQKKLSSFATTGTRKSLDLNESSCSSCSSSDCGSCGS